jgi:4-amino-4-deoxy-L-arabinose transferase-like glycosyltransferase
MNKWIYSLLSAALLLRAAFVFVVVPATNLISFEDIDMDGYSTIAGDIREGRYFFSESEQNVNRMPLYPSLLAVITTFTPDAPNFYYTAQVWHILMDCITLLCVYLFCRKYFGETAAIWAGLLYAVYPLAWYRAFLMNTEIIQTACMSVTLLMAAEYIEKPTSRLALILSGLSILVLCINPAFVLLPGFLALGMFLRVPFTKAVSLFMLIVVPISIFTLSWGVRNYMVTGTYFLFDTRGGKEFWIGNNQRSEGRWEGELRPIWDKEISEHFHKMAELGIPEEKMNNYFYQRGMEEIKSNPAGAVLLFVKKFIRFWFIPASETKLLLTIPLQSFYLLLGIPGLFIAIRRYPFVSWFLPLALTGYFCGIYTASYACIRFSQVIMPWVCALGGIPIAMLLLHFGWIKYESKNTL